MNQKLGQTLRYELMVIYYFDKEKFWVQNQVEYV